MDMWSVVVVVAVAVFAAAVAGIVMGRWADRRRASDAPGPAADLHGAIDTLVTVAGEQLTSHARAGAADLDGRKQLIDAELERMGSTLAEVSSLVQRLESERATQFGQLREQLRGVAVQHAELSRTTGALREALANAQTRGQWGERMAADVLRAAGFIEGVNYRTQVTTRSGSRPDVTFLLPGDQVVHMDVKFPLGRYLEMLEATADTDREAARSGFLQAVRDRVKELDGRGYIDPQDHTLDCVLLFIPNEQVYAFVHEHDPQLLDYALARKVILCSPTTLFGVLAVIRHAVERFAIEHTSTEILALLAGFRDQWTRFTEVIERLGRGLDTTQRAYDALTSTRRNQLERQLDRIDELASQRGISAAVVDDGVSRLAPLREVHQRRGPDTESLDTDVTRPDGS